MLFLDQLMRSAARAVEAGASPYQATDGTQWSRHWDWDAAGSCQRPVHRTLFARPDGKTRTFNCDPASGNVPFTLEVKARCRKCPACLDLRKWLWQTRAVQEFRAYVRTWFVTLTIDEPHMYMAEAKAIREFNERGGDPDYKSWEELPHPQRFRAVHGVLSKEVTKFIKRVRKASGPIRYLLVTEVGERYGRIHFHLLIHEVDPTNPVRWDVLSQRNQQNGSGRWTYGYTKVKLAKGISAARYLCKYLVKSVLARVRASIDYGNPEPPTWVAKARRRLGLAPTPSGHSASAVGRVNTPHGPSEGGTNKPPIGGLIGDEVSSGVPQQVCVSCITVPGVGLSKQPEDEPPETS